MIGFTQDGWDRHLLSYPIVAHRHHSCAVCVDVPTAALLSISLRVPSLLLLFFLFGIFLFFFFAREILRPKDEVYVQSVAGRGLAHIYFLRHPTTSFFFLTPPARPSNKQTKRRKKRPLVFSFFLFFVSSPFSIFLSCKRERRKKNEGRTTFERRALEVWNLISEISVFKSFFISGRDNLAKIFSQFSLNSF